MKNTTANLNPPIRSAWACTTLLEGGDREELVGLLQLLTGNRKEAGMKMGFATPGSSSSGNVRASPNTGWC